jgi:TP901 family phage tail tape measure protein
LPDIRINILGDATKLKSALGGAGKNMTAFGEKIGKIGKTMTIVGGAVTAAFGAIVFKTTQLGDTYDKMSKRTNVAVETLSALGYAAKISGADLDTVEKSLRYLARGMDDMAMGVGEAKDAFEYLDIAVTDTEGNLRPTIDVLKEAATKLATMTDETKQISLATDIFGARYGTQLLPLLKEGGAGIEALMKKARELGVVMSTEAAEKAAEFNDRLTDLKESVGGMGRDIGSVLIPPLIDLSEKVLKLIKRVKEWADANKPLMEMIVKVGAGLGVLAAVGGPILMAVSAFIKMKGAIALIGTATSGPVGIIILAVGALGIAAWSLYKMWKENFGGIRDFTDKVIEKMKPALDWLSEKLEQIKEVVKTLGLELGITVASLAGGGGAVGAFGDEADEAGEKIETLADQIKEKLGGTLEELKKMADLEVILKPAEEAIKKIIDSMTPYEKKLQAINDRYDEAKEKIKEYIEDEEELKIAYEVLDEGRKATITLLDREKTALEKVAEAKRKLADLTKYLTDKIYEFTHTEEEVKLRDINREYDLLIENAKEVYEGQKELAGIIKIINEERQEEIDGLKESNKLKEEAVEDNEDLADSYEKLKKPIEEAGEATKKLGILGGETWEGLTSQIKLTTTTLNTFTKEGVAATIAKIKMHFKSLIDHIRVTTLAATGIWAAMAEANIASLKASMAKQIGIVKYGYEEYLKILEKMVITPAGTVVLPSYQTGIRYVPKTTLAVVHRGEEINPPGQRSYDQRKSYSSASSINIMPGAINIITPKFSEADGQEMFGIIERQAKMRGLKLVRE